MKDVPRVNPLAQLHEVLEATASTKMSEPPKAYSLDYLSNDVNASNGLYVYIYQPWEIETSYYKVILSNIIEQLIPELELVSKYFQAEREKSDKKKKPSKKIYGSAMNNY